MKQTYCFFSTFAHRVLTAASARAKLLTLIALCLFSVGNVWGVDVAYTFSTATNNPGDAKDWYSDNIDSYTSWKATTGTSTPKYYNTGTGLRVYNNGSFSITSTKTLKTITLTFSGTSYTFSSSNNSQVQTVNPNAQSYSWSVSRACRLQKIEITYESVSSYTVTAVANPTGGGSVSVDGNKITATPNTGWQINTANPYTVTSGMATVEQSGNEFTVTPSSDCTVQINFEKEQTYTLTYQIGNDTYTKECTGGTNILSELPASATSCDATSTTFIGWTTTLINGKQPTCPELITEDATITFDMTVYAVFAKADGTTDGGSGDYELVESALDDWAGDYLIAYSPTVFMDGSLAGGDKNIGAANKSVNPGINLSGKKVAATWGDLHYLTLETCAGGYVLKTHSTTNPYIYHTNNTSNGMSANASVGYAAQYPITVKFVSSADVQLCLGENATGSVLRYNSTAKMFRYYKDCGQDPVYLYKKTAASSTTYTDYMTACEECTELEATWKTMMATNVVRQTATLSWGMSSTEHVTGYSVHVWSTSSTVYNETFTVEGAATTTLNLTDLSRETTYNWTVTALTEHGWCTTTSDAQQFVTIGAEQLPAPGNPKVVYNPETDDYTFSWDQVENATKYTMSGQFSGDISGTSSTRSLSAVTPGTTYTVKVTAKGDNGVNYIDSDPASYTFTAHTYTLTLSVTDNGTTTTKTFTLPKVTLPAETSMCEASEGWTFAGWSETDITEESTTTAPALIAAGTEYGPDNGYIKRDRTLYAVFSKVDEETVSDTYEKVTTEDDMTNGNYMIVGLGKSNTYYTLTSTPATTSGWFNGSKLGELVDVYSTTDPTQIWEIKKEGTNYLIYNAAKKQYLNINSSTLVMEDAGIPYTLSVAYAGNVLFKATKNTSYYLASHTGQNGIFNAYTQANTVYLYKNTTQIYTTSPSCTDCNDPGNNCLEYPLVLNDRGVETTMDSYWVGGKIPEPVYTPQGECTGYMFVGWTTEPDLSNLTAAEWEGKKIRFPYRMPKQAAADGKLTLYAVYSSVWTDEYEMVTDMDNVTGGEYVIASPSGTTENALSFVRVEFITEFGAEQVTPTVDDDGNDIILTTDQRIIWTVTEEEDGYTLEALHFEGMNEHSYLNISGTYMVLEKTPKHYTISQVSAAEHTFSLCSADGDACMVYNGTGFEAGAEASPLHLYKRLQDIRYSTSTNCDPSITCVGIVAVTSARGIWVESVTQPYVFAEQLTQNRDEKLVDIIATTSSSSPFTLKAVNAEGVGSHSLTIKTNEDRPNFAGRFKVVYQPTRTNVIDNGEIVVRVTEAGNPANVYATRTIKVKGRSLPGNFVLAAPTKNGWVALPADLGNSSSAYLKMPYSIEVDNEDNPTKATLAPETAIYHATMRYRENNNSWGVRLLNSNNESLCGDYSKAPDHRLWFSAKEVVNSQSWILRSLTLTDYYIRLQAESTGHHLYYNAAVDGGKIGYYEYKQQSHLRLRLLPVELTCVRYDAPDLQVRQLKSTSATLTWHYVKEMPGYEYTLDNGQTWTKFEQGTNWTVENGMSIATIDGLVAEQRYTVQVRVTVDDDTKSNCSEVGIQTFTMPECDDAPYNLWASATADVVTVMWEAEAPTAIVKIYSDKNGEHVVKEQESGATDNHQCKITGLEQNTKYWYQVFSAGTCGSAIASFTTESKDISIVEWKKDEVLVDINTEIGTGVDVVVEKRSEISNENRNIANDLFFSKYYEASGTTKLLAIYNGTKEEIDLTDITIHTGIGTWDQTIILTGRVPGDIIKPNQEIIFWTKGASALYSCVQEKIDTEDFVECVAGDKKGGELKFSGKQSIALVRDGKIIDLIGAITAQGTTISGTSPKNGVCEPSWGDIEDDKNRFARCGWGYSVEDNSKEIELSTNRCLLVRSNNVKDGKAAVEKNIGNFVTLGDGQTGVTSDCEWLGRQVEKDITDNGVQSSCDGFAYVAEFNYNNYYVSYEKIDNAVFNGTPNEDGTYTIKVSELPELACSDIRLQLTKDGEVTASLRQKVPIVVNRDAETDDQEFFRANGLDANVCATCDVVVRDGSMLTHTDHGMQEFRNMHIYHDSRLEIPEGTSMKLNKVYMFALNDTVSYAIINNAAGEEPAIAINEISHVKRIDGQYWYPFSLPYDCFIEDISALNGRELGAYGIDWGIKYYDGERRQQDGKSASLGGVSDYWYMMEENDMLEAYKGYIIGLFVPTAEEKHRKSINFVPADIHTYTETDKSKTTYVKNWPHNLDAAARHHGWNFTGSPYISLFGKQQGDALYNAQLRMGYTDTMTGEQHDVENVYISVPDGGNSRTYTQKPAGLTEVKPFTAYFVQTIDPEDEVAHTLELTYRKANRRFPEQEQNPTLAPRRIAEKDVVLFAEIDLAAATDAATVLTDNAGVLVSDRFSTGYEIGHDLTKMYAAAGKPQLYTLASDNEKMAYNALPDAFAHNVPLGMYVPQAGQYTLSLNRDASRLTEAEAVYLLHNGIIAADLLRSNYTFVAAQKGEQQGYTLDIRRVSQVVTAVDNFGPDAPYAICADGMLTIGNLPAGATVEVYDVLGRLMWQEPCTDTAAPVVVAAPQTGVYMVVVSSAQQQYVFKSLVR